MTCEISKIRLERYNTAAYIQHSAPRISWSYYGDALDWIQVAYEIKTHGRQSDETIQVNSTESIYVPWAFLPITSRESFQLSVRALSNAGDWTDWRTEDVESALMERADWHAGVSYGPCQERGFRKRPFLLRRSFSISKPSSARLYITALGLYEVSINGQRIGNHALAPGWQSYKHRLHYQVFDVTSVLQSGQNLLQAWVAEGWYAGRFGWGGGRYDLYGSDIGLIAQLELDGRMLIGTGDDGWECTYGAITSSELYDGEVVDFRLMEEMERWVPARHGLIPPVRLIAPEAPPVRKQEQVSTVSVTCSPSGKTIFDFGQNLVGWIKFSESPPTNSTIVLRHAEVLENGELGTRPLRICKATDTIHVGKEALVGWEPKFTFHGFRYVEVTGWKGISQTSLAAVVVHTDMDCLGDFDCSHDGLTRYHQNTLWGIKGNCVSVPTDCPQRDERMGWTGDLQAICPTANYLFDTSGFLANWLHDLSFEQLLDNDGRPPLVVPDVTFQEKRFAIWGDVTVLTPYDIYQSNGDTRVLKDQWESLQAWLDKTVVRDESFLWSPSNQQLGDWLDPSAPEDRPDDSQSDTILVANAFLIQSTRVASQIARLLDLQTDAERYETDLQRMLSAFRHKYITPSGLVMSDTQATLALVLQFDIVPSESRAETAKRLVWHIRRRAFKVLTGFAGTPVILPALTKSGHVNIAYRMFQEEQCPSILYPISMGATTIWERWNSMMPDGTVNKGEMTSFNHYAFGSISRFLYETVGGLSPLMAGWKKAMIRPQPGGTVTWARTSHLCPYGLFECRWSIEGDALKVCIKVPPNTTALVVLPGLEEEVGSGAKEYQIRWHADSSWPPSVLQPPPMRPQLIDHVVL